MPGTNLVGERFPRDDHAIRDVKFGYEYSRIVCRCGAVLENAREPGYGFDPDLPLVNAYQAHRREAGVARGD